MNTLDLILADLEILSKIEQNGKLRMKNNKLSLEDNNSESGYKKIVNGIWIKINRKFRQDSREYHILALQNLLLRIQIEIQNLNEEEISRLLSFCEKAIPGLIKLQNTYNNDAQCVANIEIIIQNLKILISNYK